MVAYSLYKYSVTKTIYLARLIYKRLQILSGEVVKYENGFLNNFYFTMYYQEKMAASLTAILKDLSLYDMGISIFLQDSQLYW